MKTPISFLITDIRAKDELRTRINAQVEAYNAQQAAQEAEMAAMCDEWEV